MNASDLMTRNVLTLSPGNSVRHAARLMLGHGISGLPVIDDSGVVAGMVTEGDLLRHVEPNAIEAVAHAHQGMTSEWLARDFVRGHSWRVADVMTSPVVTVAPAASLREVAALMDSRGVKRLPVVAEGRLVGIISRSDLLRCIVDDLPASVAKGDEALRISVQARLGEVERVLAQPLHVTVEQGIVHLWGAVRSMTERDMARVVVEGVAGIRGYEDHMAVVAAEA